MSEFVDKILLKALQEKASEIYIEPQQEDLRIRFRKDGVLHQAFEPLPRKIISAVVSRLKLIAGLDIVERRVPQTGYIGRIFEEHNISFWMSTLPSRYGETVVLRLLGNSFTQLALDKLIVDSDSLAIIREMASYPRGLILVTGPTDASNLTTLYSVLAELNDSTISIYTVEERLGYTLPGSTQILVKQEMGMDIASILEVVLSQNPDVIMVSDMPERETLKNAASAAFRGKLVLCGMHTEDTASAITRLREMQVESYMISGSIIGVIAQRLVRCVCSECRISYNPSSSELARFGLSASSEGDVTFYKSNSLQSQEIQEAIANGNLCKKCNGIGYIGQIGIYEVMRVTEGLRALITENAPTAKIKNFAIKEGMKTLYAYGIKLLIEGYTSLEEIERVLAGAGLETLTPSPRQRLEAIERQLEELTYQFEQAKKELEHRFKDER